MKINTAVKTPAPRTAEGAPAARITPEQELNRTVMCCMLWEDSFYESGQSVADRIKALVPQCRTEFVAAVAAHARGVQKLRHAPLLVVREMARHPLHKAVVSKLLCDVIMRPDEITEFLAIYNKDGKEKLSAQVKKGLAMAFQKFDSYALAKYNRDGAYKLRDALFLSHAKPTVDQVGTSMNTHERVYANGRGLVLRHDGLFQDLVNGTLTVPDTWEVALSGGADKRETFLRLMREKKLGALAFLRNLRNMFDSGVDYEAVCNYAQNLNVERVLPFRFISAARAVPTYEQFLEPLMLKCVAGANKLPGKTILLVDTSGSMSDRISAKSDLRRLDAAAALAVLLREVCEHVEVVAFADGVVPVPPRRGFALRDAVCNAPSGGTDTGRAVAFANAAGYDRLIVITDEQSHTHVPAPLPYKRAYVINVATNKNGVGYDKWVHIDGWSEACVDFIQAYEESFTNPR